MKFPSCIVLCLFVLALVPGCASSKVAKRQEYKGGKIPRPAHIWVYDLAATPADVPANSALAGQTVEHATPQTAEQIEAGRRAGSIVATQLVEEIRHMGMPAEHASTESQPQINDLVIRGYLLSVNEGDATKRVAIGFGSGASEISAAVEGFQMTAQGLRKLGGGEVDSGGSKSPGAALGVVGAIATANPVGLIVGTGAKAYGEYSGSSKIEGRAKDAAKEIAAALKPKFQEQGWIE
jgi:hypothetical protein